MPRQPKMIEKRKCAHCPSKNAPFGFTQMTQEEGTGYVQRTIWLCYRCRSLFEAQLLTPPQPKIPGLQNQTGDLLSRLKNR